DLEELVDFVINADDTAFGAEIPWRIHVPDFEAWWMLAVFLKLNDSAGKNSYLHHSDTTPWHVVPWDFNDSLGQSWRTYRQPATPVSLYTGNELFRRLQVHPTTGPALAARFAAELSPGGAFDLAWVQGQVDSLV